MIQSDILKARDLLFEFTVNADIQRAWKLWTTIDGISSFFTDQNRIDFRPGGAFELYFDTSKPYGQQGSEGMIILSMEEEKLFAFTWNSPPQYPSVRGMMTAVHIYFLDEGKSTRILFINSGYGFGSEWQESRGYFKRAWGEIVLPRYKHVVEGGVLSEGTEIHPLEYAEKP